MLGAIFRGTGVRRAGGLPYMIPHARSWDFLPTWFHHVRWSDAQFWQGALWIVVLWHSTFMHFHMRRNRTYGGAEAVRYNFRLYEYILEDEPDYHEKFFLWSQEVRTWRQARDRHFDFKPFSNGRFLAYDRIHPRKYETGH